MYSSRAVMFKHGVSFGSQVHVRQDQRSTALISAAWTPWCSTWAAWGAREHTYTQEDSTQSHFCHFLRLFSSQIPTQSNDCGSTTQQGSCAPAQRVSRCALECTRGSDAFVDGLGSSLHRACVARWPGFPSAAACSIWHLQMSGRSLAAGQPRLPTVVGRWPTAVGGQATAGR